MKKIKWYNENEKFDISDSANYFNFYDEKIKNDVAKEGEKTLNKTIKKFFENQNKNK